ncbi:cytidine monophosphate-N-acetylneuraminic acid hydroxylase-like isoform X2 [Rana temporaria]|uniref:cytidine monophosphate-N-acetylneuraminic acid hydroxylase-like isoform X2 n=1 Tax=Rana temporaria TaxID=8407 RepID=UPI001AAC48F6|nr:cytidine monophosphate-N-acetylneuraminic acid hydroxylase-like isoform X2 [Rana temporaria]
MEQSANTLLHITASEKENLKEGVNFLRNKESGKNFIVFKNEEEELRACKNLCKHQGGTFIKDIEDLDSSIVRCTKHNWRLDVSSMKYVNPPDSFCQEELVIEKNEDNSISLVELDPPNPWDSDPKIPVDLEVGELQITYLTHACMELKLGQKYMVFDPWVIGPAFARGWWLLHEPPSDWLERVCHADLIYISHMHSDHLSYPTLRKLAERRPDIPIFVGKTERPVFWYLNQSGVNLTNINVVPFGIWQQVDADLRFMILMDGVHPEMDTCIIVEYKEEWKAQFIKTERKKLLHYKAQLVKDLNPRIYCPFAGYFVEAHPSDKYIKETNIKNDAATLNQLITKMSNVITWTPKPGAVMDVGRVLKDPSDREAIVDPPEGTKIFKDSWDFDTYLDAMSISFTDEIFNYPSWIKEYFVWAGFKDYNLVVRMIETDEDFVDLPRGYNYLVDFSDLSFPTKRPNRDHPYEEIRSRATVMRHVVKNGLLWDDLYIGFQTRLQRDPDIYHHQFWNHFQIKLPITPPDWNAFLEQEKQSGNNAQICSVM